MIHSVTTPYAKILVSTETGMINIQSKLPQTNANFDYDVLSFQTNRDLNQDCATFSLTLVYRNEWYKRIGSNDLVVISLARPPEELKEVFIGLVDDIRKTTDYSTGKPTRAFRIVGRNLNKALVSFEVGLISKLSIAGSVNRFLGGQLKILALQRAKDILQAALEIYIDKGCRYEFANGKTLVNYYNYCLDDARGPEDKYVTEILRDASSYATFQGNLWTFLKEFKNAPFNEMYWEVGTSIKDFVRLNSDSPTRTMEKGNQQDQQEVNANEYLVFRPTPFNKSAWELLNTSQVTPSEIVTESLGRSDLETYTIYDVNSMTLAAQTSKNINGILPFWYEPYYYKYGIRTLTVSSRYLTTIGLEDISKDGKTYTGTSRDAMLSRMKDVANWNIKNPQFENGTMSVKGSNRFKIAERLYRTDEGIEYYIEGVSHTFDINRGWITNLSLTRGIAPNERFTPPWGELTQMTPEDAARINERIEAAIGNKGGEKKDG